MGARKRENMTIKEIKNIKKLKRMLSLSIYEDKFSKECCRKAGEELEKYSCEWDGKEKNLIIQAMQLNKMFENVVKALNTIEEIAKNYEARHTLQETTEVISSILGVIQETKKYPNWVNYENIGKEENEEK